MDKLEILLEEAKERVSKGKELRKKDITALGGKYYFAFAFDYYQYDAFAKHVIEAGYKPNDIVWQLIEDFMSKCNE